MSDNWHYFESQDRDEEGVVDRKGLMDTGMGSGREGGGHREGVENLIETGVAWPYCLDGTK